MWSVVSKKFGEAARPTFSHHIGPEAETSRFAEWLVYNAEHSSKVKLFLYLPNNPSSCTRVIFSVHGRERNARKYRNILVDALKDENVLLVAPRFRDGIFSSSPALTLGNMYTGTAAKEKLPESMWTFTALEEIFRLLKTSFPALETFNVFGHSAGGQFAYRFALFVKSNHVRTIVAANPGWLTAIDETVPFPYGIKGIFSDNQLRIALHRRLILIAGELDTGNDEALRTSRRARVQGQNRFERALFVFDGARNVAHLRKYHFSWELKTVPGLSHSAKNAALAALPYLLEQ